MNNFEFQMMMNDAMRQGRKVTISLDGEEREAVIRELKRYQDLSGVWQADIKLGLLGVGVVAVDALDD